MQGFAAASKMKRACLGVAVHCVTTAETRRLRELFLQLDTHNDGTITCEELKDALLKSADIQVDEIEQLFQQLDQLGDNRLCYDEFLAATLQGQLRENEAAIKATFARLDADHSGYITEENLIEVLGECDAKAFIEEADYMKDGRISYQEFFQYVTTTDESLSPIARTTVQKVLNHEDVVRQSTVSMRINRAQMGSARLKAATYDEEL